MKWSQRAVVAVIAAIMALVGLQLPANASNANIQITSAVNLRTGPSTDYPIAGELPKGARPDFICYTNSQRIGGGPGVGTTLWWKVSYQGKSGYYSSAYDSVPYDWQQSIESHYAIFACSGLPTPAIVQFKYDRQVTANWALTHAQDVQPASPSPACTWFASNALWAGGLPKAAGWSDVKDSKSNPPRSATYAPQLFQYLTRDTTIAQAMSLTNRFGSGRVPEAQLGDLIAYDWSNDGTIDHMSVVVNIGANDYPDVSEWGTAGGGGTRSKYVKRGWTWSENNHNWLQAVDGNQGMTAWLLHIRS